MRGLLANNHHIYYLKDTQMDERLTLLLAPIISAYRPHDPIPTREELGDKVNTTHIRLNEL
jgi:hypothetical protein